MIRGKGRRVRRGWTSMRRRHASICGYNTTSLSSLSGEPPLGHFFYSPGQSRPARAGGAHSTRCSGQWWNDRATVSDRVAHPVSLDVPVRPERDNGLGTALPPLRMCAGERAAVEPAISGQRVIQGVNKGNEEQQGVAEQQLLLQHSSRTRGTCDDGKWNKGTQRTRAVPTYIQ